MISSRKRVFRVDTVFNCLRSVTFVNEDTQRLVSLPRKALRKGVVKIPENSWKAAMRTVNESAVHDLL